MSEESRIKRWRQNKRQHGLKAVTIWLSAEEELRLKDLAAHERCAPSQVIQRALAQYPGAQVHSIPTETLQIRDLIRAELAALGITIPPEERSVTEGDTVGPTDLCHPEPLAHEYEAAHGHDLVTEPLSAPPKVTPAALERQILDWLSEHPQGESVEGLSRGLGIPQSKIRLRVNALIKRQVIKMQGTGRALCYVLTKVEASKISD